MSDHKILHRIPAIALAGALALAVAPLGVALAEPQAPATTADAAQSTTEAAATTEAATTTAETSPATTTEASGTSATTSSTTTDAATPSAETPATELTAQAITSAELPKETFFLTSSLGNSLVVELANGNTATGANVWVYGANNTAAQQWTAVPHYAADDTTIEYYVIHSAKDSTKVLDVAGGTAKNGTNVDIWTENGTLAQRWWAENTSTGIVLHSMVGDGNTYVLDIAGANTTNGTNLQIWEHNGSAAQSFSALGKLAAPTSGECASLTEGTYTMTSSGLFATVPGQSSTTVALTGDATPTGDAGQSFTIAFDATAKYYTIASQCSGLLLEPENASPLDGARVIQNGTTAAGQMSRYWSITSADNGKTFTITNAATGCVLTFSGSSLTTSRTATATWTLGTSSTAWTPEGLKAIAKSTPAEQKITSGTFIIESANARDKVLDIASGSKGDGANLQIWTSNMTSAQKYVVAPAVDDSGMVTITNLNSGKVVDVASGSSASGANAQQYHSNDTAAQHWYILENKDASGNPDGTYTIWSALGREEVLDVAGAHTSDGTNVQIWRSNESNAQKWVLWDVAKGLPSFDSSKTTPATVNLEGYTTITSAANTDVTFDVTSGSTKSGAKVQLWAQNGTPAQGFELEPVVQPDKTTLYHLVNLNSGKVVGVANGDLLPGAALEQQDLSTDNRSQLWALVETTPGSGSFALVSAASGNAIDTAGAAQSGVALAMAAYDPAKAKATQQWKIASNSWAPSLSEGCYSIISAIDGSHVLDDNGSSFDEGANVQSWSSNGSAAQRWYVRNVSADPNDLAHAVYTIQNVASGKYVSAKGTTRGSNVALTSDSKGTSSEWALSYEPGYGYTFLNVAARNAGNTLALDIAGGSSADGANVQVWDHATNDNKAQGFRLQQVDLVPAGYYELAPNCATGKRLDAAGGFMSAGANAQIWDGNGTGAQTWYVYPAGNGWYTMECNGRGFNLDVDGGGSPSANVHVWYNSNGGWAAQHFRFVMTETGIKVESQCGGVLDVSGAGTYNGANVDTWTWNGSSAQTWCIASTSQKWSRYNELELRINRYCDWATMIANDDSHGFSELCHINGPDYDCSGLIIQSLMQAGMNTNGAYSTFDMANCLCAVGWQRIWFYYGWEGSFQRGDILIKEDTHSTVYIGNGLAVAAHESEPGTEWNDRCWGAYGDQDGNEIAVDSVDPYWGWNYLVRPTIWSQWY